MLEKIISFVSLFDAPSITYSSLTDLMMRVVYVCAVVILVAFLGICISKVRERREKKKHKHSGTRRKP